MHPTKQTMKQEGMSLSQAKAFINTFDLNHIVRRLVRIEKWLLEEALTAVTQYRRFLYLKKKYGTQCVLPPSYEIDEVWHSHVLHSEDYVPFCQKVFGTYLHHRVHLVAEAKSLHELDEKFKKTQELYHHEFGEYIYAIKKPWLIRILHKTKNLLLNNKEKCDETFQTSV